MVNHSDLADMHLINRYKKGVRFWLCVIDIYSNYPWIVPLKEKKGITITDALQKVSNEFRYKPSKIWVDKCSSEFYDRSMKQSLRDKNIDMYSTHNEGKSVVSEKIIRALKNNISKHMTAVSKNVFINKLNDIPDKYNDIYHKQ